MSNLNEHELLVQRINLLEFHQRLLGNMLRNSNFDFYRVIIEKGITEQEVKNFYQLCESLSMKMAEQKAEGYVHFHPLLIELSASLPANLKIEEIVKACLQQKLFEPLFKELHKYV
ncbi:DUF1878 family protein [Neobacillus cucumis]|uniref:DUF1878 family protein n=1 Tax=Neobacillus cucumis TaxID=1740721 RepID=UPI0028534277|nr:DUF1878 family protein [Neobacillus cucumis]MDR4945852.1 DUF1878 family protein [Neobacillus cucumis]